MVGLQTLNLSIGVRVPVSQHKVLDIINSYSKSIINIEDGNALFYNL